MEIFFKEKGLWDCVSQASDESETRSELQQSDACKNDLALACLLMLVDVFCKLSGMTLRDPATVWEKLKDLYSAVSEPAIVANYCCYSKFR